MRLHAFVDCLDARFGIRTWQVEKWTRIILEVLLLGACAAPSVVTSRDFVVQFVVGAMRAYQVEIAREKASILTRAAEAGLVPPRAKLAPKKEETLETIAWHELLIQWVWPVVVPIAQACAGNSSGLTITIGLTVGATLVRAVFDRVAMPAWRASRLEWQGRR